MNVQIDKILYKYKCVKTVTYKDGDWKGYSTSRISVDNWFFFLWITYSLYSLWLKVFVTSQSCFMQFCNDFLIWINCLLLSLGSFSTHLLINKVKGKLLSCTTTFHLKIDNTIIKTYLTLFLGPISKVKFYKMFTWQQFESMKTFTPFVSIERDIRWICLNALGKGFLKPIFCYTGKAILS